MWVLTCTVRGTSSVPPMNLVHDVEFGSVLDERSGHASSPHPDGDHCTASLLTRHPPCWPPCQLVPPPAPLVFSFRFLLLLDSHRCDRSWGVFDFLDLVSSWTRAAVVAVRSVEDFR